jgi:hypothetical protein
MSATQVVIEKAVWWILGTITTLIGVLGLMILNTITGNIQDLRIHQQDITSRLTKVESIIEERTHRWPSPNLAH